MLKEKKLGFIGAGQMCEAILAGALEKQVLAAGGVTVCDISAQRLAALADKYRVQTAENKPDGAAAASLAAGSDILVLSLKPQVAREALAPLAAALPAGTLVISIMGGVTLATLEELLPNSPVIRVMPNTPMLVGLGAAGIATGQKTTPAQLEDCLELFRAVGSCQVVEEKLIDPLTAVSGCGPAFAYLFIEALADGGVEQGLPRPMAQELAVQTLLGAAAMVQQTGQHPGELKDKVCSPGGGTIAGVHALEDGAFRATVMNAVAKARARMEALGRES